MVGEEQSGFQARQRVDGSGVVVRQVCEKYLRKGKDRCFGLSWI